MLKLRTLFTYGFTFYLLAIASILQAQEIDRNPFQPPHLVANNTSSIANNFSHTSPILPPSLVKVHRLSYAQAPELVQGLRELFTGRLSVDKSTNSIILQGTAEEHRLLKEMLQSLDIATSQVTLEAKIIALNNEDNKNLGINWNWDTIPQRETSSDTDDTDTSSSDSNYGGNFKFWRGYAFRFNATLNALISHGKAKILAKPCIITIPGRQASIFIGDHIPVQTEKHDNSGSYTATEYVDAGIKLQYTPIISQDGKMITAQVHTEVSTPTLISELKNYRITSRTADTHVRMYSGETLVIGGLINEEEQNTLQKIPFLGDIPLIKHFFRNHTKKRSKVEVILLLTPHISAAGQSPAIYQGVEGNDK
ncbi:MAG: secretin N-terminal domain-containing protein [Phascolarctobacterium sp.]|nr:secretin N-terminal domain-containing protein [Phascolarctobacterium sp.]